jgi:hypothetical protein
LVHFLAVSLKIESGEMLTPLILRPGSLAIMWAFQRQMSDYLPFPFQSLSKNMSDLAAAGPITA